MQIYRTFADMYPGFFIYFSIAYNLYSARGKHFPY